MVCIKFVGVSLHSAARWVFVFFLKLASQIKTTFFNFTNFTSWKLGVFEHKEWVVNEMSHFE